MPEFKSLVVFDSETTSLPKFDHNTTKIIELAFLACEINHLKNEKKLPRVLHKLVLLFHPQKLIHPGATECSGLSNELLDNLQPFSEEDVRMLEHFLKRLPPPVCIVAHNGNGFDFKILRKMLQQLNTGFPDGVYCADSLQAFKMLHPKFNKRKCGESIGDIYTTPIKQRTISENTLKYKSCRELFPEHEAFSQAVSSFPELYENKEPGADTPSTNIPRSYKLKDIYYFFHKNNFVDAHMAEADAKALLGCIVQCEKFIDWMNKNAVPFNDIPPL